MEEGLNEKEWILCRIQGDMFRDSFRYAECCSPMVIRRLMNSDFIKYLDSGYFLRMCSTPTDPFTEIEKQFGHSEYGKTKYTQDELYWIGYIYRYWCIKYNVSSKRLYKFLPANALRAMYPKYHTLPAAEAVERIREAKGITGEDVNEQVNYAPGFRNFVPLPKREPLTPEQEAAYREEIAKGVKFLRELREKQEKEAAAAADVAYEDKP
ncbi:MAG: antitoxin [Clostridia bacterium]|nr:antitoxin [Clostridia bacterium]